MNKLLALLTLCSLELLIGAEQKAAKVQTPTTEPNAIAQVSSDDEKSLNRKKLLDEVRRGVVIIKTIAHAGSNLWDQSDSWSGTGFIVNKEKGIIVTNRHVAGENAVCTYQIKFSDGSTTEAKQIYFDPHFDFAFLRVDTKTLPDNAIQLEFSKELPRVNESIYAMGNSAGEEFSTYKGTIFSVYESIGPFPEQTFKFAGVTVGGASGSPVFDDKGKVIGILYGGKFVSAAALPIRYVEMALRELEKGKIPSRKSIGLLLDYADLDKLQKVGVLSAEGVSEYKKTFPDSHNKIIQVNTRIKGYDSFDVIQPGDVIWKLDGKLVGPNLMDMSFSLDRSEKPVMLQVYRQGKLVDIELKPREINYMPAMEILNFMGASWYGTTDQVRLTSGENEGVFLASVSESSPLKEIVGRSFWSRATIRIVEVDGKPIKSLSDIINLIPQLQKKELVQVKYINYAGNSLFGNSTSNDREPRYGIIRYESKFDTVKHYKFNSEHKEWDIVPIK